jgi:hypothetical protein
LAIYALAYRRLFGCLPASTELRFLTPFVVVGRAAASQRSIEKAQAEIDEVSAGIRANAFPGEPTYQACRYCSYAGICPSRRPD